MEWMKLTFPSNSKCHSHIFYIPNTQDGMDETQLPFDLKVLLLLFPLKTQKGMDDTQLPFDLTAFILHLLPPENSKGNGLHSTSLRSQSVHPTSSSP
jgi:hypothetical protein